MNGRSGDARTGAGRGDGQGPGGGGARAASGAVAARSRVRCGSVRAARAVSDAGEYVDTAPALARLCGRLAGVPWLAVDTEFVRDSTYYPQLCLVQVATLDVVAAIDPLAVTDLAPLEALLADRRTVKVFHAARQDLEIFALRGTVPGPVFDTQVAAPLLGFPDQIGYADLVRRVLDVQLDKGHARTDWHRRPLAPAQIEYAEADVRYLARLYLQMRAALEARGRLVWLDGAFAGLEDPRLYVTEPASAWERVKGARSLRAHELGILQALAAWRERQAIAEDRPRGWILKDEMLLDIARQRPRSIEDLARVRGLPERVLRKHGDALLGLVTDALVQAPAELRRELPPRRLEPREEVLLDLLVALMRTRAVAADLHPSVVASRGDIEALIVDPQGAHELRGGWRRGLVGADMEALIAGRATLSWAGGELTVGAC